MKHTITVVFIVLFFLLRSDVFAQSRHALRLGLESYVVNTIVFGNSTATPVSDGVAVSFSASDSVLSSSYTNVFLSATPFSNGFRINAESPVFMRGNRQYLRVFDTLDLAFNPRVSCDELDIGAYESEVIRTKIITQPTLNERIYEGETVSLVVTAIGENLSFQWQKNNESLIAEISSTLTITDVSASDIGYYSVIVVGACCRDTSVAVRLDIVLKPEPEPQPEPEPEPEPEPDPEPDPDPNQELTHLGQRLPTTLVTPNDDGLNDYLYIQGIEQHPRNTVTIVNSHGQAVITIENYDNRNRRWEGRDQRGRAVPDGVYYYILVVEGMRPMAGIVLIRLSSQR